MPISRRTHSITGSAASCRAVTSARAMRLLARRNRTRLCGERRPVLLRPVHGLGAARQFGRDRRSVRADNGAWSRLHAQGGSFLSSIGYLNDKHAHTWDFVNQPLAYQAFLGGQFGDDGLQLKWLAPTDFYLQFGAEVGSGLNFPASDRATNGAGAWRYMGTSAAISATATPGVPASHTSARGRTAAAMTTPISSASP